MVVFGGGTFGKQLVHEDEALVNGIIALLKETPELTCPLLPSEDTGKYDCLWIWKWISLDTESSYALIFDFLVSWMWEINVFCLLATQFMIFLLKQPKWIKQNSWLLIWSNYETGPKLSLPSYCKSWSVFIFHQVNPLIFIFGFQLLVNCPQTSIIVF